MNDFNKYIIGYSLLILAMLPTSIQAMECYIGLEGLELQIHRLKDAVYMGNIDEVKSILLQGIDLNQNIPQVDSPVSIAIRRAGKSLALDTSDADTRLQIIELLLRNGLNINQQQGLYNRTALEDALAVDLPNTSIIELLLGHGAAINERILSLVLDKENKDEILQVLTDHQQLLEKAKTNPNKELLLESIEYNRPYVVQLIVDGKPELVTSEIIELAKKISPASAPILEHKLRS